MKWTSLSRYTSSRRDQGQTKNTDRKKMLLTIQCQIGKSRDPEDQLWLYTPGTSEEESSKCSKLTSIAFDSLYRPSSSNLWMQIRIIFLFLIAIATQFLKNYNVQYFCMVWFVFDQHPHKDRDKNKNAAFHESQGLHRFWVAEMSVWNVLNWNGTKSHWIAEK